MDINYRETLIRKKKTLRRYLYVNAELLEQLTDNNILTDDEKNKVENDESEKSFRLLSIMRDKSNEDIKKFIDILCASDQDHVAYILNPSKGSTPMTGKHRDKLHAALSKLPKCLDVDGNVITYLYSKYIIGEEEKDLLRSPSLDTNKAIELLIAFLMRKKDEAYQIFLDALVEDEQEHVATFIDSEDNRVLMSKANLLILNECSEYLLDNLYLGTGVLVKLRRKHIITSYQHKSLSNINQNRKKVEKFAQIIERRSNSAFSDFIQVLNESGQSHIASHLGQIVKVHVNSSGVAQETLENVLSEQQIIAEHGVRVITGYPTGSIILVCFCRTIDDLKTLWTACNTGSLLELLNSIFVKKRVNITCTSVYFDANEYKTLSSYFRRQIMSKTFKDVLRDIANNKFNSSLVLNDKLLTYLKQKEVLTEDDMEDIQSNLSNNESSPVYDCDKLCETLSRKAEIAFHIFMNSLELSNKSLRSEILSGLVNFKETRSSDVKYLDLDSLEEVDLAIKPTSRASSEIDSASNPTSRSSSENDLTEMKSTDSGIYELDDTTEIDLASNPTSGASSEVYTDLILKTISRDGSEGSRVRKKDVRGIATWNSILYVVTRGSDEIMESSYDPMEFERWQKVPGLDRPVALDICKKSEMMFVCDIQNFVYKIDLKTKTHVVWEIKRDGACGLFINDKSNVLVTCRDYLMECSADGTIVYNDIPLSEVVTAIKAELDTKDESYDREFIGLTPQAVEVNDTIILPLCFSPESCRQNFALSFLCLMDLKGKFLKCFPPVDPSERQNRAFEPRSWKPIQVVKDSANNIIVAERFRNLILMFNTGLTKWKVLLDLNQYAQIDSPIRIAVCNKQKRLFVGGCNRKMKTFPIDDIGKEFFIATI